MNAVPDPYHHGDLRRVLLAAAAEAVAADGASALSLRELARRAGVSHAAPAHHFGDKTGLLTALAAEGYRLLAAALAAAWQATGSFLEVGVAYLMFALDHPGHFAVMFEPTLLRADDDELRRARAGSRGLLYGPAGRSGAPSYEAAVAAWSLMHGLATLIRAGNLPAEATADPADFARRVGAHLFASPRATRRRR